MLKPKTIIVIAVVVLFISLLFYFLYQKNSKGSEHEKQTVVRGICSPADGFYKMPAALGLPLVQDIPGYPDEGMINAFVQNEMDELSWKSFIALNWPAFADGSPDTTMNLGQTSRFTVFEHWMPTSSIYRGDTLEPRPWNYKFLDMRDSTVSESETGLRIIPELKKFSRKNADNEHLIDQNGNYTFFQVYYNRQMYDYVVNGKLYNKKGQEEFARSWPSLAEGLKVKDANDKPFNIEQNYKRLYFAVGNFKDTMIKVDGKSFYFETNPGAVIVKTAWRVLTHKDDRSRYYTRTVKIAGDETKVIGLVGMHIMHKVSEATQWVWSTFEHVDNVPDMDSNKNVTVNNHINYSYYNPLIKDTSIINVITEVGADSLRGSHRPVQAARVLKHQPNAMKLNTYYQGKIRESDPKSVWQYYELIGTQWPGNPGPLLTAGGDYTPSLLANAVLETSSQGTSSCMGCHSEARFLYNDTLSRKFGFNSDFVWGLANVR